MTYIQQLLLLCPLIFVSALVDSIAGGGALISLPAYYAVGLSPHMVLGTNKFSAFAGSTTSAIRFIKNKNFYGKALLPSIIFALIGSTIGARFALFVSEAILRYMLIVALPILAVFMLTKKDFTEPSKNVDSSDKRVLFICSITSVILGFYDGFFGPGAGTFLILTYTAIIGFDLLTSMGNAKIVNWSTNIAALVVFIIGGKVQYSLAIPAACCTILGNYIGSGLAIKNGKKIVRPVMIVVLILLLGKLVYDTFFTTGV